MPRVIECYDISHVQGSETVASMVVFVDGKPEKTRYRTYKLQRGGVGSPDDFASMYEVLSRRFRRAREAALEAQSRGDPDSLQESTWALPDLIVVDGGKGQLGMALAAARDVGIDVRPGVGLPIVGLAKEREPEGAAPPPAETPDGEASTAPDASAPASEGLALEARTAAPEVPALASEVPAPGDAAAATPVPPRELPVLPLVETPTRRRGGKKTAEPAGRRPDRVFLAQAKDAIPIRPNSAEMFVLAHLRDEAHRFAVTFHRNQRRRRTLRSVLSDIAGVGSARQRELLRHFGSVRKIRDASVEDLASVPGVSRKTAEAVRAYFDAHGEVAPPLPDQVPVSAAPADVPLPPGPHAGSSPALEGADEVTVVVEENAAEEAEEDALEAAFAEVEEAS